MQKLTALFTTVSGWVLIISFLIGGFTAIKSGGGNGVSDIITILTLIGAVLHPTNMIAGRSVKRA